MPAYRTRRARTALPVLLILVGIGLLASIGGAVRADPKVTIAVGAPTHRVRNALHETAWAVTAALPRSSQEADVYLQLRWSRLPADATRFEVRECPRPVVASASDTTCPAVVAFRAADVPVAIDLGRLETVQPGQSLDLVVRIATPGTTRHSGVHLIANATPCAPAQAAHLWRRQHTAPDVPHHLAVRGLDQCATRPVPWKLLGLLLLGGGVLAPVTAFLIKDLQ